MGADAEDVLERREQVQSPPGLQEEMRGLVPISGRMKGKTACNVAGSTDEVVHARFQAGFPCVHGKTRWVRRDETVSQTPDLRSPSLAEQVASYVSAVAFWHISTVMYSVAFRLPTLLSSKAISHHAPAHQHAWLSAQGIRLAAILS